MLITNSILRAYSQLHVAIPWVFIALAVFVAIFPVVTWLLQ